MLWMIQRVFYGRLGLRPEEVTGWDLTAREHLELWPFAALFLIMGVASPLWMRAIDTYGAPTANVNFRRFRSNNPNPKLLRMPNRKHPDLADGKCGDVKNISAAFLTGSNSL